MKKTLTGIMAFAPLVLLVLTFVIPFAMIAAGDDLGMGLGIFSMIVPVLCVLLTFVDIIWFIVIACRKSHWDTTQKVIWGIVLYCLNIVAFPFFWWLAILKDE